MKKDSPVLRWTIDHSVVTVIFSSKESLNVKEQVRDILTKAYEERFQKELERQEKSR